MTTRNEFRPPQDKNWELIKKGGGPTEYPDCDAVVVYDNTDIQVEDSGLGHVRTERLIKILTEKGAAQYCNLRFDFDPNTSFVDVTEITIYPQNGKKYQIKPNTVIKNLPQPEHLLYWGHRMLVASLPRLNIGDALLYKVYRKGYNIAYLRSEEDDKYIPPMYGHYYDIVLFEDHLPMLAKNYTISLPRNKPFHYEVYNGTLKTSLRFNESQVILHASKSETNAIKKETRLSDLSEFATMLVLTTVPDWEERSRWFWQANADMFEVDDAIKKQTNEIIEGLKNDDEIFLALNHWVAQKIRYAGYSIAGAKEGYTLHSGIMTFQERCGVCKDIASMLITMLRAAGYDSYPASTRAGSRAVDLPADQFNHCVVAVRREDGSYTMMDPTWGVYSRELWSSAEAEQHYLIGTPQGESLGEVPARPSSVSQLNIQNQVVLLADGTLTGELRIDSHGRGDTNFRRALALNGKEQRRVFLERLLAPLATNLEIVDYSYSDVDDFSQPMSIRYQYRITNGALVSGNLLFCHSPLACFFNNKLLCRHMEVAKTAERQHPAFLYYTQKIVGHETLEIPRGYQVKVFPRVNKIDHEVISFDYQWQSQEQKIQLRTCLDFKNRRVQPKQYPQFKKAVDAMKDLASRWLVLHCDKSAQS